VALNIDDNKMKIYDSLINIEYVYYPGLKESMINVLKKLRSMKKLSDDHPDCELIHPECQINSDCGPLSILFAELFFEKQEQFIQNLKYEEEVFKLRAHHK
jgi:Ulp1 family protease